MRTALSHPHARPRTPRNAFAAGAAHRLHAAGVPLPPAHGGSRRDRHDPQGQGRDRGLSAARRNGAALAVLAAEPLSYGAPIGLLPGPARTGTAPNTGTSVRDS